MYLIFLERFLRTSKNNVGVINITDAAIKVGYKAEEILKLSGASRDKIRDAFDALLHQINDNDDIVDVLETEEIEDERIRTGTRNN